MLAAARSQYRTQARIARAGLAQARRAGNSRAAARTVNLYQATAVTASLASLDDVLAEQHIDASADASVQRGSLVSDTAAVASMFDKVEQPYAFDRLVLTLVQDSGRTAASVGMATKPAVTGYVRYLNPPSCSRCAILAGRVYRYSDGFARHPGCDCGMVATNKSTGRDLVTDPMQAIRAGQVTGLSKADMAAVDAGADLNRVVNVRRKAAGLVHGSSVIERAGSLTPAGCLSLASDRAQALTLLKKYGYVI